MVEWYEFMSEEIVQIPGIYVYKYTKEDGRGLFQYGGSCNISLA